MKGKNEMKHLIININKKEGKAELYSVLQNVGGGQFVFVEYETDQTMVKFDRELSTKGNRVENPLFEQVSKTVGVQGQTLVSYANKMRKTNPDFESKPLNGQEYIDAQGQSTEKMSNVIRYKTTGNETFRIFPNSGGVKTQYFVNGIPATKEQLAIIQRNKPARSKSPLMNIGIDKIKKINADGHQIELV
jgi:hypothetical protein